MFKRSARTFLVAGLVLAAGLFATQAAQAQGLSINIGGGPGYYGGFYPPVNNGVFPTYGGYGYNPYVTGYRGSTYFPTHNYRSNMAPYIRHYGYPGCW